MITERSLATSFPDFWQELLPLLTPACVHLLSVGYEEHLQDANGHELAAVDAHDETRDPAIVSEFAYHLAKKAFTRGMSVTAAFADSTIQSAAEKASFDLIASYEGTTVPSDYGLNAAELDEGLQLALRYELFANMQGGTKLCNFQVPIKGCGFLHACAADLVINDYLIEIKTVKRSLAGKDIRQLVVYLALSSAVQDESWQYAGFFNPRRSTFHRFRVHEFIDLMSGGKSVVDVYSELREFTCSSDAQLDSVF